MNGYVDNGKTQFQQVVFDFLSNIKNSGLPSEMNLNYITDRITAHVQNPVFEKLKKLSYLS